MSTPEQEAGAIKVVFHIGSQKTGTTAIQQVFKKNRRVLREQGVLYPRLPDRHAHHKLLSVAFERELPRGTQLGTDLDAAVAMSREAWRDVQRQVAKVRPRVVLISSEFLLMAAHVERVARFAGQYLGPRPRTSSSSPTYAHRPSITFR